jgi:hypothetical protein
MATLRARILQLQDQENTLQLEINELTNQVFAPVSDQASRDQALANVGQAQNRLSAVRTELDQARKNLDEMNVQGPPAASRDLQSR